jgi:nucleotide-binding universal stress UspA family protein
MIDSIVVPLDGSAVSEQAVPFAHALAQAGQATLHLLHVYVPYSADPLYVPGVPVIDAEGNLHARDHPHAYLAQISHRLRDQGSIVISHAVRDVDGSIAHTILHYAQTVGAGLIVLTTHGRGGFEHWWLGSVAETMARSSSVPLLVVPSGCSVSTSSLVPKRILIPLDGSVTAAGILHHAQELSTLTDATYMLLRVVVPARLHEHSPFFSPVDLDPARTERECVEARHNLECVAGDLDPIGERVETHVVVASHPALAIVEAAKPMGIWIAMATHGRGGFQRLLLGSTADKVLRIAETPVLLYRPEPSEDDNS